MKIINYKIASATVSCKVGTDIEYGVRLGTDCENDLENQAAFVMTMSKALEMELLINGFLCLV